MSWETKPSVVSYTPFNKPFIDCLHTDRLYVAVGGNGGSAHPSDAIGELAANLMLHERFPSELDRSPFRLQFADEWAAWMENSSAGW